jgi:hypothetical protein
MAGKLRRNLGNKGKAMSKKLNPQRIKIGSVNDFTIPLTTKEGQRITFRAGQIGPVVEMAQGCRIFMVGANAYHEVNEPAGLVNQLVDACHQNAALGFYDIPVAPPAPVDAVSNDAKPNRKERRAAKAKK